MRELRAFSRITYHASLLLHPAALRRSTTVMRDWCHVLDGLDLQSRRGERLDRGLASAAGALHAHMNALHAGAERLASRLLGRDGRREGSALLRTLEARLA